MTRRPRWTGGTGQPVGWPPAGTAPTARARAARRAGGEASRVRVREARRASPGGSSVDGIFPNLTHWSNSVPSQLWFARKRHHHRAVEPQPVWPGRTRLFRGTPKSWLHPVNVSVRPLNGALVQQPIVEVQRGLDDYHVGESDPKQRDVVQDVKRRFLRRFEGFVSVDLGEPGNVDRASRMMRSPGSSRQCGVSENGRHRCFSSLSSVDPT